MKISHGSHATSVAGENFGSPKALIDSPASSARLGRVGLVVNPQNCILELLGLQYEFNNSRLLIQSNCNRTEYLCGPCVRLTLVEGV